VAAARTSGRGVTRVVEEVRGTDVELEEVEAGVEPAEGGPSAWRCCRGEEDRTCGASVTWRGTPAMVRHGVTRGRSPRGQRRRQRPERQLGHSGVAVRCVGGGHDKQSREVGESERAERRSHGELLRPRDASG
jgi:hypothetical protein